MTPRTLAISAGTRKHRFINGLVAWNRYVWLLVPLLAVPGLWRFIAQGLPASHDGAIHLLRLVLLDDLVKQGILFPRWVPQLMFGNGNPVLSYYAPLTYYLAEVWVLAGFDHAQAIMIAMATLVIAAGWGMYLLALDIFGQEERWPALIAATAYMYAPYLLTNVFVRGAIAEVGAQALLPWLLWSVRRLMLAPEPRAYLAPVLATLTALVLMHTVSLILLPAVLATYVLLLWMRGDRRRSRLGWLGLAAAGAIGATAFFWLPLIAERSYLSAQAYDSALNVFMPQNVWRLDNFLDTALRFGYSSSAPFRLGLAQLLLAAAGIVAARRRDGEWLFFVAVALLASLSVGAWALPIWTSSPILLVVQFPWRLLTIISLPLALFAGAILLSLRPGWKQALAGAGLLALVILVHAPQLDEMDPLAALPARASPEQVAQYEMLAGWVGVTTTGEFTPRWAQATAYAPAGEEKIAELDVRPEHGNPLALSAKLSSPTGGPLRFASLYFPGWEVRLDSQTALATYPSTNLGLLTVDLPPGDHEISLHWAGTPLQRAATVLTLLAICALVVIAWALSRRRGLVFAGSLSLACLVALFLWPAGRQQVLAPATPIGTADMELVGYRWAQRPADTLSLFPYWYMSEPPADLRVHLELQDAAGRVVATAIRRPYHNSVQADHWPPGTLVDDAHALVLPPDLPAGMYQLYLGLAPPEDESSLQLLGWLDLSATPTRPEQVKPTYATTEAFGEHMLLAGYDISLGGRSLSPAGDHSPVLARPGDIVAYTLYWRGAGLIDRDYLARVELVDQQGIGIIGDEHVAGFPFGVTTTWSPFRVMVDRHKLTLTQTFEPGLYSVQLRVLDPDSHEPLPGSTGDHIAFRPIKVVGGTMGDPQHVTDVAIGDFAHIIGYDVSPNQPVLSDGSSLTVTLYYRSDVATPVDFTRFIHLVGEGGVVTSQDGAPQSGGNPSSSWIPGEVIVDRVTLKLPSDTAPEELSLVVGFYRLDGDLPRVTLRDADGRRLAGDQVELLRITVQ